MNSRAYLLVAFAVVGGGGAAGAACSSSSNSGDDFGSPDAGGNDATTDSASGHDGATYDTGIDTGSQDAGVTGDCSAVQGACDIVAQDCPSGQECVLTAGSNNTTTTSCQPTTSSEVIEKGNPCCPGPTNTCAPGLECNGQTDCVDGGTPTGTCAARCCEGNDSVCGMTPGGVQGRCNIEVVDSDGGPLYSICDYSSACKPFGVQPCPTGQECLVTDTAGTSTCVSIFNPPGVGEGQPCTSENACQSGFECLGPADGGSTCIMLCLVPGSSPPFDAGGLADGPLTGGCNTGKTCNGPDVSAIFPPWLGICVP